MGGVLMIPRTHILAALFAGLVCVQVASAQSPTSVRIASVVLRPLHAAEVPAQQTGLLKQVVVSEGQQVEQGQVLAKLDSRQAKLAVARAEFELSQAKAKSQNEISIRYAVKALEVAKAELKRSTESIEKFAKSISQSQLDVERLTIEKLSLEREQAIHELELERFGVELKQAEVDSAKLVLKQHEVTAPFAGKVVLIRGRVGEWVEVGAQVLRLVAVDKLRAEGFLPAEQANAAMVGKQVTLRVTTSGKVTEFPGEIRFISPEMDPVTRQVRVWAEIPNDRGLLRPGQQGELEITR